MLDRFVDWMIARFANRPPDLTIGPIEKPSIRRWHLLRWRGWQFALHEIVNSDDDRALHDHVSWNISLVIRGHGYVEQLADRQLWVAAWRPYFRRATTPHRVVLTDGRCWSFWFRGPPTREWGFHCPKGWRHWKDYVAERDYRAPGSTSTVGRGCDE